MEAAKVQQGHKRTNLHDTEDREVIETENRYQQVRRVAAILRRANAAALESERQRNIRVEVLKLHRIEGRLSRKRGS